MRSGDGGHPDRGLAASCTIVTERLGKRLLLRAVNLARPEAGYAASCTELFDCPVNLGDARNDFRFPEGFRYEPLV